MRILMFGWEFPPFSSGGLGTHCYGLTKALHDQGHEITFVMPSTDSDIKPGFLKIIQAGRDKLIKIGSWLAPYKPSLLGIKGKGGKEAYGWNFFQEVQRYTTLAVEAIKDEVFDVIHCHDWMTFPAGIKAKEMTKKPLVVTVHSTEHDRTANLSLNSWISHVEWDGMFHADRVITVSNYMRERIFERYNVPKEKIDVVYNAVDADNYSNEKISVNLDNRLVLFLGRVTIQKGPDYFLEAAYRVLKKRKDVTFVVAGKGDMLPQMINKSIRMGISDNVVFTGFVPSIEKYYRSADLYVMPSVSEPFGITALEAMACGTPVIVSKQSGVSEVVRHCMSVDFWDVDELANKILGTLEYDCLRKTMSRNGHDEAHRITWNNVARDTAEVYKKLFNN
jgi:glycogen(starch) synthase